MSLNVWQKMFLNNMASLEKKGMDNGKIEVFPEEIYERLSHYIFCNIPASIQFKYLDPTPHAGRCFERANVLSMAFDDCYWVMGDLKSLEILYGKQTARHAWVEADDWVYDPTNIRRYKKSLYYEMHKPKKISKTPKETLLLDEQYQKNINGEVNKLSLVSTIILIQGIAEKSNNPVFINEVAEYLRALGYESIWQLQQEMIETWNDLIAGKEIDKSRIYAYYQKLNNVN